MTCRIKRPAGWAKALGHCCCSEHERCETATADAVFFTSCFLKRLRNSTSSRVRRTFAAIFHTFHAFSHTAHTLPHLWRRGALQQRFQHPAAGRVSAHPRSIFSMERSHAVRELPVEGVKGVEGVAGVRRAAFVEPKASLQVERVQVQAQFQTYAPSTPSTLSHLHAPCPYPRMHTRMDAPRVDSLAEYPWRLGSALGPRAVAESRHSSAGARPCSGVIPAHPGRPSSTFGVGGVGRVWEGCKHQVSGGARSQGLARELSLLIEAGLAAPAGLGCGQGVGRVCTQHCQGIQSTFQHTCSSLLQTQLCTASPLAAALAAACLFLSTLQSYSHPN